MNYFWLHMLPGVVRRRIEGRHTWHSLIDNTGWLMADRVFRLGFSLFVNACVARYLTPESYGVLTYAVSFVSLFGAFVALGMDKIIVRELARNEARKDELLGTACLLILAAGALSTVAAVIGSAWFRKDDIETRILVAILASGLIFQAFDVIAFWFESQLRSKFTVYAKSSAFFVIAVVNLLLILLHAPLVTFAWATLAETVIGALGLLAVFYLSHGNLGGWRVRLAVGKELLVASWPFVMAGLATMIYMKIDMIMLGELVGNGAVGVYGAAVRISEACYFIPIVITASVFPVMLRCRGVDRQQYLRRFQQLYDLMVWLAVAISVPILLLSDQIISLVYGAQYADAAPVLAIHIWATVFVFLGVASGRWLLAEDLNRYMFTRTIIGCGVNVLLNYLWIPTYGTVGAAVATLAAQVTAAYLVDPVYPATREMFFMKTRSLLLVSTIKRMMNG